MIELTIPGNPPSDNTLYGHRAFGKRVMKYMTAKGKEYKRLASECAFGKYPMTTKPIAIRLKIYFGDNRKRDVQGHLKAVIDSFEGILYENDSQVTELYASKEKDKENPRTELEMWEL